MLQQQLRCKQQLQLGRLTEAHSKVAMLLHAQ
jgi:hypothetical protein